MDIHLECDHQSDHICFPLLRSLHPRYLHYNIWQEDSFSLSTTDWTELALPLPSPPKKEIKNPVTAKMISENPSLFKIVTPINVDQFEFLLNNHLNQPFVKSVCHGLQDGFWSFVNILKDGYPITHDASLSTPKDPAEASFLHAQQHIEEQKGHFSAPFGKNLFPGMYSMPIHAVPKPGSTDLHMVTDQSTEQFPLNSMIPCDNIKGYLLDNMKHLSKELLFFHLFFWQPITYTLQIRCF